MDDVDVLIIGAGPSGAIAAHTLARKGFSVICLEQGDWVSPEEFPGGKPEFELLCRTKWDWDPNRRQRHADYPINVEDSDLPAVMFNAVGGTSVLFGAHWMRLLPSDFRVHALDGVGEDWPITYEDVEPFYREVDEFIGVSGLGGDPAYPEQDFPMPPHPIGAGGTRMASAMNSLGWHWWPGTNAIPSSGFKQMAQCVRWGVCERGCPVGAKASFDRAYWPFATAAGAQLITGARVARITLDHRGLTNGAIWLDSSGGEHRVRANSVVLAANGIGTPRLLLMSNDRHSDGLSNSSGMVGKNLMMHPNCSVSGLYEQDLESWNGPSGQLIYSMQFYETDKSRDFIRGAKWHLVPMPGVLEILELFRDLPFEQRWGHNLHRLSRYAGKGLVWSACIEDLPEESNQVTLDGSLCDSNGLPAPRVRYRLSENSRRNIEFSLDRMMEAHEAAGASHRFVNPLLPSGHLLGTARMGLDAENSVVDSYGRSHDIPNLFIVDGSVMVTGGGVNPTATIAALALRTAHFMADIASTQRVPV